MEEFVYTINENIFWFGFCEIYNKTNTPTLKLSYKIMQTGCIIPSNWGLFTDGLNVFCNK